MPMIDRALRLVLGLAVIPWSNTAAAGESDRILRLPPEGLSVRLPPGWTAARGEDPFLVLRREPLEVRFRHLSANPAAEMPSGHERWLVSGAVRAWRRYAAPPDEPGSFRGEARREDGGGIEVSVDLPRAAAGLASELFHILKCLDVTPYAEPRRYVELRSDWTLALPKGWTVDPQRDDVASFRSEDGTTSLRIELLQGVEERSATMGFDSGHVDGAGRYAAARALLELAASDGWTAVGAQLRTRVELGGAGTAALVAASLRGKADEPAWLHVVAAPMSVQVPGGVRLVLLQRGKGKAPPLLLPNVLEGFRWRGAAGPLRPPSSLAPLPDEPSHHGMGTDGPSQLHFHVPPRWEPLARAEANGHGRLRFRCEPTLEVVLEYLPKPAPDTATNWLQSLESRLAEATPSVVRNIDAATGVRIKLSDRTGWTPPRNPPAPLGPTRLRLMAAIITLPHGQLHAHVLGAVDAVDLEANTFLRWLGSIRWIE